MPDLYENPTRWLPERFLENPAILKRFDLTSQLIPSDSRTLLDVGTGNGAFLRYIEDKGCSLNLAGLERARVPIASAVCAAEIIPGSLEKLPFADRAFDVVTALEIIEHLPYGVYERGLSELSRVAYEYIIISVPYRENWWPVRCPYCGCQFHKDYHMRRYDKETMHNLFSSFRCEKTVLVEISEYAIMPLVRYVRQVRNPYQPFPDNTICPQCSFTHRRVESKEFRGVKSKSKINEIARFIPHRSSPRWIIGLYRRTEGAAKG